MCIWKYTIVLLWCVFTYSEGCDSHGFGIILNGEFHYHFIHFSTQYKTYRRILMRHTRLLVKQRQIKRELPEMSGLEATILEFYGYETIKLTIKEKKIDKLLFITIYKAIVGLNEYEILSETKNKITYIVGNTLVEQWFIAFFGRFIKIFSIDKAKKVTLLE